MSNKQRIVNLVGTVMLLGAMSMLARAAEEAPSTNPTTEKPAPILHRRTTLPAGWFKSAKHAGALTDTTVQPVQPVVHFDTTGDSKQNGVVERMQQVRDAVLFKDLKPSPPVDGKSKSDKASSRRPPSANRTAQQASDDPSKRRQSAEVEASSQPAQQLNSVEKNASPAKQPTASGLSLPSVMRSSQSATRPADEAPDRTTDPSGRREAADSVSAQPHAQQAQTKPSNASAAAASRKTVGRSSEKKRPPQGDIATLETATADSSETLPSVMKPSVPREDLSQGVQTERMTLTAIDDGESSSRQSEVNRQRFTVTPMAELSGSSSATADKAILTEDESPMLSVVTRGPRTIVVGKTATFVVDLRNRSEASAKNVVVRVNIPQWVEIIQKQPTHGSAHIQPDESGQSVLTWQVAHIDGGGQEKLRLDLIPRGSRPVDFGITWTFSPAKATTQIQVQEPKLHLSVVGPQDVLYGETKVYTITVSNPGTGDAENVVLNLLPLVPGEQVAGVRNLGTIQAGSRRTMEVELTARQTGRLNVRAEVSGDGGLRAEARQDVLVRRAILDVVVEGPPMKYAGTRGRFTVRVANKGDAAATDVRLVATLPAGAKDVASSDGGSLDPNTGQVQWRVGVLRPGSSRVLQLECALTAAGDNRLDVRSVASGDLTALGATVTRVESLADLKLTVDDPQGAVAVGSDVTYEVRIVNRGTKEAGNIQIYGYFSEGVEPVSVSGWRGQVNEGEVVLQTIPRLGAGQKMVIQISARADRSGDHVFRAELECSDPETKLAVEEWTRFYRDKLPSRQANQAPTSGPGAKRLKLQRY